MDAVLLTGILMLTKMTIAAEGFYFHFRRGGRSIDQKHDTSDKERRRHIIFVRAPHPPVPDEQDDDDAMMPSGKDNLLYLYKSESAQSRCVWRGRWGNCVIDGIEMSPGFVLFLRRNKGEEWKNSRKVLICDAAQIFF